MMDEQAATSPLHPMPVQVRASSPLRMQQGQIVIDFTNFKEDEPEHSEQSFSHLHRPNQDKNSTPIYLPIDQPFPRPEQDRIHSADSEIRELRPPERYHPTQMGLLASMEGLRSDEKREEEPPREGEEEKVEEMDIRESLSGLFEKVERSHSSEGRVVMESRREFLQGPRSATLRAQLGRGLAKGHTLSMVLAKSSHLLSVFWPEFQLRFRGEERPLMAAKRTSFKPYCTYLISSSAHEFDERSSSCLGKVKATLEGRVVNVFAPGLGPAAAARQHEIPRELVATIVYMQAEGEAPRRFTLYAKKPQFHYYLAFPQVQLYGPELPLSVLYADPAARDKIDLFTNRPPARDLHSQAYVLNFHGKVQRPSVRNFILEDERGNEAMLLGKASENRFNVEISHPLSPLVGFALALSSFDPLWL